LDNGMNYLEIFKGLYVFHQLN